MPLFDTDAPKRADGKNPNIVPPTYKDVAVDSKYVDFRNLILHVEGMRWLTKGYYNQYQTADTELASQEINRHEVYQQYLLINELELRVTSPLSVNVNDENKEFIITGSSSMFPGLVPYEGDMFIADVGDGRAGLFTLTEVTRKTHLTDSVFEISYQCTELLTPLRKKDLDSKVQKTQTFVREFVAVNRNPYLVDSELKIYESIRSYLTSLPETYYSSFYDQEYSTLLVPDQKTPLGATTTVYDPAVVSFIKSIISLDKHYRLTSVKSIQCDTPDSRPQQTLFDALIRNDINVLDTASLKSVRYYAKAVKQRPEFAGVRYSGIDQVYLKANNEEHFGTGLSKPLDPSAPREFNRPVTIVTSTEMASPSGEMVQVPYIYPVTHDDYYVLSANFYELKHESMSLLEILTYQRLMGTPNDLTKLMELVKSATTWGLVEQYYYYPIIIYLLIYAMGDIN